MAKEKPVILTCAQPTGQLHLGNYLGAIKNWAALLDDYQCYFGIVDLHAITTPYVPAELRKNTLTCLAQYIACGLDPAKCRIFVQSHVIGHTELAWVLGCLTPMGQLQRMTQFKDKARGKESGSIGAGLLYYPVLMAADILLYNADLVPVGDDQKQHLELTRDIAAKFNNTYSPTFKVPEPYKHGSGGRVMSLQDPTKKMSKSDANESGVLFLLDPPNILRKKIMSAVTDTGKEIVAREDKPGISNLLDIMSAVTDRSAGDLEKEFVGQGYATFKTAVADAVIAHLEPIREKCNALMEDKETLNKVLQEGASDAQRRANRTLSKVYRKAGFMERPTLER